MLTESINLWSDNSKILRNNWKLISQTIFYGVKKLIPRRFNPLSRYGCLLPVRDGPVRLKAAEMVYTQNVKVGKLGADAGNPPFIVLIPV